MRSKRWLVVGLVCALWGPLAAPGRTQPAPGASAAQGTGKAQAPKKRPRNQPEPRVDIAPAVAALTGADNAAAVKAAETLATSSDPAAHEALLDALAFGMPGTVALAALAAVTVHPGPSDVDMLARYASHHHPAVRSAALAALARYPAPTARRVVTRGLRDMTPSVRAAAADAAARGRIREAIEPLLALLARGEQSAAAALAAMADAALARKLGDQLGTVPDATLATTLGLVLRRPDFGPDPARVELVRTLGKIQDPEAISALAEYLDAAPKNPPRESRMEAQRMVEARLGGGN
jgi:hypothetical protein